MKLPPRLLWVDLETTGLGKDVQILEVAAVVTDNRLNEIAFVNAIVLPPGLVLNEYVLKMHVKNGLLADLRHGRPVAEVDALLAGFTYAHNAAGGPVCGSSVHVDRAWIADHMPLFAKCFNHRVFDVSTLKLADMIATGTLESPDESKDAEHRALADIRYSIRTAREFLGFE